MSTKRILLVNDNPLWLKAMTVGLEHAGFEVIPEKDGLIALNLARTKRPDVVITDIVMHTINGFELCRCIRSIELIENLPVILFSNLVMTAKDFREAEDAGANAVLPGSPDLSVLIRKILELSK